MTHHTDPELLNTVLQLLTDQGSQGFAEGLRLLVNVAIGGMAIGVTSKFLTIGS